jgi:hydrogenase maturation protease
MILVLGYGNPTRSDDAASWEVVRRLEAREIPGVELRSSQQLEVELVEEWGAYERVLFIDSDPRVDKVLVEKVAPDGDAAASTHHLTPGALLKLSKILYVSTPQLYLCRVPARDFKFGETFSPETRQAMDEAVEAVLSWIHEKPLGTGG